MYTARSTELKIGFGPIFTFCKLFVHNIIKYTDDYLNVVVLFQSFMGLTVFRRYHELLIYISISWIFRRYHELLIYIHISWIFRKYHELLIYINIPWIFRRYHELLIYINISWIFRRYHELLIFINISWIFRRYHELSEIYKYILNI